MGQFIKQYLFLLPLLFFFSLSSKASHAIGGEILITWTGTGNYYSVKLNKYVNRLSEESHGLDVEPQAFVSIYEKNTNKWITNFTLNRISNNLVNTTTNACVDITKVETELQIFTSVLNMSGYTSSSGYYMVWDYCCRNETITNIVKPIVNGAIGEQDAFLYIEFPNISYKNSSPVFKQLGNEYFCTNTLNTFDYSATDSNGDSLVYSLVSPYQSSYYYPTYSYPSNNFNQGGSIPGAYYQGIYVWAGPSPFAGVDFLSGYSAANPIPGLVGLNINKNTGLLSFNPSQTGTFLFGVKVIEYRNGIQIGEVHRDFQFNVQNCPVNNKPSIGFKDPLIHATDTLSVLLKEEKCFSLYFTDPDALIRTELLYPSATGAAYPAFAIGLSSVITLNKTIDTVFSNICFKPCLVGTIKETGYYPITVLVSDRRCPTKYDTLLFTLKVVVPDNAIPVVTIDPPLNPKVVKVDSTLHFKVLGTDADPGDLLSLTMFGRTKAMSFKNVSDSTSTISSDFTWKPSCEDVQDGTYNVYFIVKDNSCIIGHADTVYQKIRVEDNAVSFDSMRITNLVTPNNDQKNDYYEVPGIPLGNCEYFFKHIEIYNRWGSRVFYSQDRHFKWYPDVADGLYYYSIDLNKDKRKGWIQVVGGQ